MILFFLTRCGATLNRLIFMYLWLDGHLKCVRSVGAPTLGSKDTPRILRKDAGCGKFEYPARQKHSLLFYHEDSGEMFVGGTDFVFKMNMDDNEIIETFPLKTTARSSCQEGSCENVIMVMERFQDSLFVCGTNGQQPQCWKLFSSANNRSLEIVESYEGRGISPSVYTQNSLSLTVEGDLYAAAQLSKDKGSLQFRRTAGVRNGVSMQENWVSEPTFISASWVRRREEPDNEKIYVFFREKNSDQGPEADPWISKVARVCKVDQGGPKRILQNTWTSFLKARLLCGFPEDSLYYNRLQDTFVLHADVWNNTRVYALFSSSWNSTAVCIYSVGMIDEIFETSTFQGYNQDVPQPRPGSCVKNSRSLPFATLNVAKYHPQMTDKVNSLHQRAPFYVSSDTYTKIAVDQVRAVDGRTYNILLLATDTGKIHKVLEAGLESFIISETQLSDISTVQSMKLDSKKKKLMVGLSEKVSIMDLQRCEEYNNSCADCVLARDPYCAWTKFGCSPTVPGGVQNVKDGHITACPSEEEQRQGKRPKRNLDTTAMTHHSVALGVPFYLSCPIDSYHADYTWQHRDQRSPCLQMQSSCLHLIPAVQRKDYGLYECVSVEKNHTKVVKIYNLTAQMIPKKAIIDRAHLNKDDASAGVPQIVLCILGLAVAALVTTVP